MKKTIFAIIIIIILVSTTFSYADEFIPVKINGNTESVRLVNILKGKDELKSEVPSFILGDRTLMPVRFVTESFGAEVLWENSTRTVTVNYKGDRIVFQIDSNKAYINDEEKILDDNSIPKLVTFSKLNDTRTMVPARFVSEILGYDVGWDNQTSTVSITEPVSGPPDYAAEISEIAVEYDGDGIPTIRVESDKELKYSYKYIELSGKLVIDIEDSVLNIPRMFDTPGDITVEHPDVTRVQYSQFLINPYITRIAVTMSDGIDVDIEKIRRGDGIEIYFDAEGTDSNNGIPVINPDDSGTDEPDNDDLAVESIVSVDKDMVISNDEAREIMDSETIIEVIDKISGQLTGLGNGIPTELLKNVIVEVLKTDMNGEEVIRINGFFNGKYQVFKLDNPTRVVLDIPDALLAGEALQTQPIETGFIKQIRMSQYKATSDDTSNIVRIIFDIKDGITNPDIEVRQVEKALLILPKESLWNYFSYENMDKTRGLFRINLTERSEYDVNFDERSKELVVRVPLENSNLPIGLTSMDDNQISRIIVERDATHAIMRVSFRRNQSIEVLSRDRASVIEIATTRNESMTPEDMTIVLDAGHGGMDPGAMWNDIKEKDINLEITLKLRDSLSALGYNVVMTRETDSYPELLERTALANSLNADMFISIHGNANVKTEIKGIEILYCPANECAIKDENQYPFTKAIHDNMVEEIGRYSRGIIKRPNLIVLNKTKMLSVLVEVGYISNAEESALILSNDYQMKVVRGITNGVVEYTNTY